MTVTMRVYYTLPVVSLGAMRRYRILVPVTLALSEYIWFEPTEKYEIDWSSGIGRIFKALTEIHYLKVI